MSKHLLKYSLLISTLFCLASCGGGGGSDDVSINISENSSDIADVINTDTRKSWTVPEILSEPRKGGAGGTAKCGGEFGFARCICTPDVPSYVRYRPSIVECNGNAGAILSGRLLNVFSIVVRDSQNRDRWPEAGSGFGGCNFSLANSESPPNACSAFKVQNRFYVANETAEVHCFGASGYSNIFADAVRLTAKLSDDPFSNNDDIERYCLNSGEESLN